MKGRRPDVLSCADIRDVVNEIADQVNHDLGEAHKDKYFHDIILLYSFQENILKWMVFAQFLWLLHSRPRAKVDEETIKGLRSHCKRMSHDQALKTALFLGIIDARLYSRLDAIRGERNAVVHQFWLYKHRQNRLVLRKKLEKLACGADGLVRAFNKLIKEVGVDELFELEL